MKEKNQENLETPEIRKWSRWLTRGKAKSWIIRPMRHIFTGIAYRVHKNSDARFVGRRRPTTSAPAPRETRTAHSSLAIRKRPTSWCISDDDLTSANWSRGGKRDLDNSFYQKGNIFFRVQCYIFVLFFFVLFCELSVVTTWIDSSNPNRLSRVRFSKVRRNRCPNRGSDGRNSTSPVRSPVIWQVRDHPLLSPHRKFSRDPSHPLLLAAQLHALLQQIF